MVSEIPMNMTALQDFSLNLSISTDPSELLDKVVATANSTTNHYLGWGILLGMIVIIYFILSDKTGFADFGYDDARAIGIAFGIVSLFAVTLMEINFITNLKAVGFFVIMFLMLNIYVLWYENRE